VLFATKWVSMMNISDETIQTLKASLLFQGILTDDIKAMLTCLNARIASYDKGVFIYRVGDVVSDLGIVLKGNVHLIEEDFWGNRNILSSAKEGDLFAESAACVQKMPLNISVFTTEATTVIFLNVERVLATCTSACKFHGRLVQNLLMVVAQQNLVGTQKLRLTSKRSIKDKILAYLSDAAQLSGTKEVDIPFNRQELSDYLAVDRSALSKELSKLRDGGIISFRKNHFTLHGN
jgi:CRP/FNR family transcriptional regulator, dissimilatory nitrate respiration regulator